MVDQWPDTLVYFAANCSSQSVEVTGSAAHVTQKDLVILVDSTTEPSLRLVGHLLILPVGQMCAN